MGLSQLLTDSVSVTANDQGPWRQYVLDHIDWLKARIQPTEIQDLLMNQYRYDLERFLRDEVRLQLDVAWIVLLLNDMSCDFEFVQPGTYLIPQDALINSLYHSFATLRANSQ